MSIFLQKVVYKTTKQSIKRPQEVCDFFNAIPPQIPDLRKFPTYRPCTFPMATKRHPNKTLMNHVFFVHQMSGCLSSLLHYVLECLYHFYFYEVWQYTTIRR